MARPIQRSVVFDAAVRAQLAYLVDQGRIERLVRLREELAEFDLPRKCTPLIGRFAKSGLRQYSVGPKQRVWYTVSGREVTIREVHRTHPKATD